MKLLNVDANAKTSKGRKHGYLTGVMYLAPWRAAGVLVCPSAELAGCHISCLNTAGRGGIAAGRATFAPHGVTLPDNAIQRARIARTRLFADNLAGFLAKLSEEIDALARRAGREGLTPCVRLNGTSDIRWESLPFAGDRSIFDVWQGIQFYDYTKLPGRVLQKRPANYHLTLSWSGAAWRYHRQVRDASRATLTSVAVVSEAERGPALEALRHDLGLTRIIDGDKHDLRFLDGPGALVRLSPKGSARRDHSGFVLRASHSVADPSMHRASSHESVTHV